MNLIKFNLQYQRLPHFSWTFGTATSPESPKSIPADFGLNEKWTSCVLWDSASFLCIFAFHGILLIWKLALFIRVAWIHKASKQHSITYDFQSSLQQLTHGWHALLSYTLILWLGWTNSNMFWRVPWLQKQINLCSDFQWKATYYLTIN